MRATTLVTKAGTRLRFTAKTLSRDGRRLGYLVDDFDYTTAVSRGSFRGHFVLPFTTAPGAGTRRLQFVGAVDQVLVG